MNPTTNDWLYLGLILFIPFFLMWVDSHERPWNKPKK